MWEPANGKREIILNTSERTEYRYAGKSKIHTKGELGIYFQIIPKPGIYL